MFKTWRKEKKRTTKAFIIFSLHKFLREFTHLFNPLLSLTHIETFPYTLLEGIIRTIICKVSNRQAEPLAIPKGMVNYLAFNVNNSDTVTFFTINISLCNFKYMFFRFLSKR
jgi:hypothetical protein